MNQWSWLKKRSLSKVSPRARALRVPSHLAVPRTANQHRALDPLETLIPAEPEHPIIEKSNVVLMRWPGNFKLVWNVLRACSNLNQNVGFLARGLPPPFYSTRHFCLFNRKTYPPKWLKLVSLTVRASESCLHRNGRQLPYASIMLTFLPLHLHPEETAHRPDTSEILRCQDRANSESAPAERGLKNTSHGSAVILRIPSVRRNA